MSTPYKKEDFSNGNEIRWCPGCGDYAILAALQKALPDIGLPPEQHVFVSGIGCAGRLPYYMNAFGFHTIHGRATAVATGLKAMRDDLCVWVITGDGDALSIGANHLMHVLRRNPNINILLFNNQVYGLTKGQYSPTSQNGQVTKTSPKGLRQEPVNPLLFALASGASFVARAVDKDPQHLSTILQAAAAHPGTAFVEIYQDCNIFNHGAFDAFAMKASRNTETITLTHGQPLRNGDDKALAMDASGGLVLSTDTAAAVVHDTGNFMAAMRLAQLHYPEYPVPLGIYYQKQRQSHVVHQPIEKTMADLAALYRVKASWEQG